MEQYKLNNLKDKASHLVNRNLPEEATKTALVLPLLQILGYDVFDPSQIIPEYYCDIARSKGEKVDYAIMVNDKVEVLLECKSMGTQLNNHRCQLARYFVSSSAEFAVLTNGTIYEFFTDCDNPNLMDNEPFFVFNILDYTERDYRVLESFQMSGFDKDTIKSTISNLRLASNINTKIKYIFENPSDAFIDWLLKIPIDSSDSTPSDKQQLFKQLLDEYIQLDYSYNGEDSKEDDANTVTIHKEKKHPPFRFSMVGIKPGEQILFDPSKLLCTVVDDSHISYDGEVYSLSGFTMTHTLTKSGKSLIAAQGPGYFSYKGENLNTLRKQAEKLNPRLNDRV